MKPEIIQGNFHVDERGKIVFFNDLDLTAIKRMYFVEHPDTVVVRAWQAHKQEQKWMMVLHGSFTVVLVQPDNWESPSPQLKAVEFHLNAEKNEVLHIPGGYANGFKAGNPSSKMMVFSDFTVEESSNDNYRFDKTLWYNW